MGEAGPAVAEQGLGAEMVPRVTCDLGVFMNAEWRYAGSAIADPSGAYPQ